MLAGHCRPALRAADGGGVRFVVGLAEWLTEWLTDQCQGVQSFLRS